MEVGPDLSSKCAKRSVTHENAGREIVASRRASIQRFFSPGLLGVGLRVPNQATSCGYDSQSVEPSNQQH